jgi:DNA-binding beta-propeller fold protein YncE
MRITALLCVLFAGLAADFVPTSMAATLYVNAVNGSDSAAGTSAAGALKSIARAAARSRPGDTVLVAPGTYPDQVSIAGFPDAAERTVFRAEPAGQAVLDGPPQRLRFSVRRPKVSIVGFVCRHSREHAIEFSSPAHEALVDGCTLLDNELDGIFFNDCRGGRVQNCIVARSGRNGVWFRKSQEGAVVACTLTNNRHAGINLDNTPGLIAFNNILAASSTAIHVSPLSLATLRCDHNLFDVALLASIPGADMLATRNAGTLADWRAISGQDQHSLSADPLLSAPAKDPFVPQTPPRGVCSPALQDGLRTTSFAGLDAPPTDMTGRTALAAVGAIWADKPVAAPPFAQLTLPDAGSLSINIRSGDGQIVRTLLRGYPAPRGRLDLYWDGRDNFGDPAPPATYRWDAVAHNICGLDDGSVGNNGQPPYGNTRYSHGVWSLAVDADGNLYQNCFWDEAGHDVRRFKADGTPDWTIPFYQRNVAGGLGTAVATDGRYVFASLARQSKGEGGVRNICDDIRRLDAATGAPANFPGAANNLIVVNAQPKPWLHQQRLSEKDSRRLFGVRGLAVDAQRLWVANYTAGRIESYDKESGGKRGEFAVDQPLGLAVAADGTLWVANGGDRVTQFTPAGQRRSEITGLKDPYAVAVGGPDHHLYVSELEAGCIRQYALDAVAARLVSTLGHAAPSSGPVEPDGFRFRQSSGLAVDGLGRISVTDPGNHRIVRLLADGKPWQTLYSDFVMAPFVDPRMPDALLSGDREYEVDYDAGTWRPSHRWAPADGQFAGDMALRRRLPNGGDYLFILGGHRGGVVVYAVENGALRRSALLGGRWTGLDDLGAGDVAGRFSWRDTNGNGAVEENEIQWSDRPVKGKSFYSGLAPGWWVDDRGDLWLADQVTKSIERLRLLGFDARANPRYDWAQCETVVPADNSPWKFIPKNLRVTAEGEIYAQGTVATARELGAFWMGGTAVARFAPNGTRRWVLPLPQMTVALATDGDFWYTVEGTAAKVSMFTSDGLFVTSFAPGKPSGYYSGWVDHAMGLAAFTHPRRQTHYVYAEEDLFGKCIRYRIEGLPTLRSYGGEFSWKTGGR